ncbi:hypothetical protein AGABI1DRAFT_109132 [Agaricus bisporus var. burnettii JB137-S8]|uniref:Uncharacterized protein n=1 Tax=Agaricus bisporus var. burnettii (strain JB137-S8 / ATCC MYA-4627 / FGSC 10392) TaxID=597362 RepID=K5XMQ4_AGABU|nr:uncharacterized protein AGABI1DRAFT_109132 [Agaricus bisporus var. burnettii JB137-S8]EKM75890.1 hypothetical protein AGABI1DRAFT_109132 [Agaricus bisporus var. burnettii JB137-S8]
MESDCNHTGSTDGLTLGIKKFILNDTVNACASFLNQINLSSKCRTSEIVCFKDPDHHEGGDVKPVLFHVKRLLSQIVIDSPHLTISHNFLHIQSGPLGPPRLWREESLPIITHYSNFFSLIFNLSHDVTKDSVFPGLLDLARPLTSTIETIESRHAGFLLPDAWDLFFEFLIQCQNVRFMLGVTGPWWERLCRYLSPTANGASTGSLFPVLRMIDFDRNVAVMQGPRWADIISFDDLEALCKHRAKIGMPLERIDMYQGILEIDSSGTIGAEPASWDWTSEEDDEEDEEDEDEEDEEEEDEEDEEEEDEEEEDEE